MALISNWRAVTVRASNRTLQTPAVLLPAQTAALLLRIKRPCAANPGVIWSAATQLRITAVFVADGIEYLVSGTPIGGVALAKDGTEQQETYLYYRLPYTKEGATYKRLGETAITPVTGYLRVEFLSGNAVTTEVMAEVLEAPAPVIDIHRSVSYDNDAEAVATNASSLTFSLTVASNSDRHIIVGTAAWDSTAANTLPSGITYAGAALSAVGNRIDAGGNRSSIWGKTAPATGANNVVVTMPAACQELGANALSSFGVDQTTPTANFTSAEYTGGTDPSLNVTAATNDLVYDVLYTDGGVATVGAGQTQRAQTVITGSVRILASTEPGAATVTMSWTANAGNKCHSAVAIKQATGGSPQSITGAGAIATAAAFGTAKLNLQVVASAIASAQAFGTATIQPGAVSVTPTAIASAAAFGTAKLNLQLVVGGIPSAQAFGSPQLNLKITPAGIVSAETFGAAQLNRNITTSAIASAEAFGSPVVTVAGGAQSITGAGAIATAAAFGTAKLNLQLVVGGIASAAAFGTAQLSLHITAIGIASAQAFGTATVLAGGVNITAPGIPSAAAFGTATVSGGIVIVPAEGFVLPGRTVNFTLAARGTTFLLPERPTDLVNPKET